MTSLHRRLPVLLLVLLVLLVACGGPSATGFQSWTGLDLVLPEGWQVFERRDTLLSVADAPLGDEDGDVGERTVAVQLTYEPGSSAQAWRDLVTGDGGTIEVDERIDLDGLPATKLVFDWVTNGVPTREMVVLVPSRELVMLFQPVPVSGQTDAPEVFLEHVEEFEAILASIDFGAPPDSL